MTKIPTPNELDNLQQAQDDVAFRKTVELLTQSLLRDYVTGKTLHTRVFASTVNERIIKRVVQEFDEKGWTVGFGDRERDQREGDYYKVLIQANIKINH